MMMAPSFILLLYLSAWLVRCSPADRPLGFGVWRQRGRGIEYDRLRGAIYLGELIYYIWLFMCDTLLCIHAYFHALNYIRVIVKFMWLWYLCDMWHVCSLLWSLYMSCHLVMLICFASAFYSDSNELYFLYSCLFHIYWVHHVGLGHISLSNFFVSLSKAYMNQACWKPHLFHILEVVLSSITKKGEIESRPLVGFRWLMIIRYYYD